MYVLLFFSSYIHIHSIVVEWYRAEHILLPVLAGRNNAVTQTKKSRMISSAQQQKWLRKQLQISFPCQTPPAEVVSSDSPLLDSDAIKRVMQTSFLLEYMWTER